jgi:hypothetical protein
MENALKEIINESKKLAARPFAILGTITSKKAY